MNHTIISTVWYTGGTSLRKQIPDALFMHCCPDAVKLGRQGHRIITTYRDPYATAASWYNRHSKWITGTWRKQWIDWHLLKPERIYQLDELEEHENKFGDAVLLHDAYSKGDMDYFHQFIPEEDINFAIDLVNKVMEAPNAYA